MNPLSNPHWTGMVFLVATFFQYIFGAVFVLGWSNGLDTQPLVFLEEDPQTYWEYIIVEFCVGVFFLSIFFVKKILKK